MTGSAARRAAYENSGVNPRARDLMSKVVRQAWTVTDDDVRATRVAGLSEDEIFELTICAALGQATRQLNSAIAALDSASASNLSTVAAAARQGSRGSR
jgi:alkylhydroperoxidase family enzyme